MVITVITCSKLSYNLIKQFSCSKVQSNESAFTSKHFKENESM